MQRESKKRAARNRKFRMAVRLLSEELHDRIVKGRCPIKIEIRDFWDKPGYLPTIHKQATVGEESYVADQVRKRLQTFYDLCAVPITHAAFKYSIEELLDLSKKEAIRLVSARPGKPTTGLYISSVADGNLFAAYEDVNGDRQILGRARAFNARANRELRNNRLSKSAKTALLENTKKLAKELSTVQLRLPY